jgi:hypothetical protein
MPFGGDLELSAVAIEKFRQHQCFVHRVTGERLVEV